MRAKITTQSKSALTMMTMRKKRTRGKRKNITRTTIAKVIINRTRKAKKL